MIELNINELVMKRSKEIAMRKEEILEAFIAKYGYEPDDMIVCEQPSTGSFWVEKRTTEYKHAQECLKIAEEKLEKCLAFLTDMVRVFGNRLDIQCGSGFDEGAQKLLKELEDNDA